jgi:hypothetical protein
MPGLTVVMAIGSIAIDRVDVRLMAQAPSPMTIVSGSLANRSPGDALRTARVVDVCEEYKVNDVIIEAGIVIATGR